MITRATAIFRQSRIISATLCDVVWLAFLLVMMPASANAEDIAVSSLLSQIITVAELPAEAHDTLQAIKQGGPFAYERDGVVFRNYERILPQRQRGYYREYTVRTPGARHRGARRIVCGPLPECYYSADHYQTFKRIRE